MAAWAEISGSDLAQGDLVTGVLVPLVGAEFPEDLTVNVDELDVIIATQTCDLANSKITSVLVVRTMPITDFEQDNPSYKQRKNWNGVAQGRIAALHLLPDPDNSSSQDRAWVVDFREVYSLPVLYLRAHAANFGSRRRLCSPYLEHFSQSFGHFFMRVALPEVLRFEADFQAIYGQQGNCLSPSAWCSILGPNFGPKRPGTRRN
jgi:hypothetical protein